MRSGVTHRDELLMGRDRYTRRKAHTEKSYLDAMGRSLWVDRWSSGRSAVRSVL